MKQNDTKPILYSTSVVSLMELAQIENEYVDHLRGYVDELQRKVDYIKEYSQIGKHPELENEQQRTQFVANPLNAFGLVRRAHEDWSKVLDFIKMVENPGTQFEEMDRLMAKAPTEEDMNEALRGMAKIHEIYDLEPADIAKGLLDGRQYMAQMPTPDRVLLADYIYNKTDYRRAAQWYKTALQNETADAQREEIRKKYIISRLKDGRSDEVEKYLAELSQSREESLSTIDKPTSTQLGCRGLYPARTNLSCHYNFETTPFLRLAPIKTEILNLEPLIVLHHDVLYDREVAFAKNVTMHDMMDGVSGSNNNIIISKIKELDVNGTIEINRRIADMTGLSLKGSSPVQVFNYGLGGHFREHFDFVGEDRDDEINKFLVSDGNRFATILFFASNVAQGGTLVFPRLQIAVRPERGAALVWHNLNNACEPEPLTEHSVCPVIVGSRWVLTKFLFEKAQMFTKPCYKL
ncbi:prolyl 4-hydroxylase subunit alpha-2-like isoform X1 [Scaptodrosophila lebanonensis]|uniref:procollagen-proline 4-dioxygenase n=1 Tax=Drosophila lebanonensis TaxID=7225 RepID=A0A6J2TCK2_DROLE|nr:prolyl 4-hydroxylase subunit alpha-2-like isoform X1 [Scaptodrosophila lebanonensis]